MWRNRRFKASEEHCGVKRTAACAGAMVRSARAAPTDIGIDVSVMMRAMPERGLEQSVLCGVRERRPSTTMTIPHQTNVCMDGVCVLFAAKMNRVHGCMRQRPAKTWMQPLPTEGSVFSVALPLRRETSPSAARRLVNCLRR